MVGLGRLWGRLGRPPRVLSPGQELSGFSSSPGRAEFRAEVLQKKREALASGEDSAELMEEHRRLMAWNDEENARQRARRSA